MSALNAKHFHDDNAARAYLEAIRWPTDPACPHCGSIDKGHYALNGKAHRPGLWKCKNCRQQFSVTVGTVFEHSKVGLSKWLTATYLMCSAKKGISAHQLHRTLGVTYKTAWFMAHRIRLAMDQPAGVFGSGGGIVEADECYIGSPLTSQRALATTGSPRISRTTVHFKTDTVTFNTVSLRRALDRRKGLS